MTLTPAYGRDYRSKAEVEAAFAADQDFRDALTGQYANKSDLQSSGERTVNIRYAKLRKVAVIKVPVAF